MGWGRLVFFHEYNSRTPDVQIKQGSHWWYGKYENVVHNKKL